MAKRSTLIEELQLEILKIKKEHEALADEYDNQPTIEGTDTFCESTMKRRIELVGLTFDMEMQIKNKKDKITILQTGIEIFGDKI